MKSQPPLMEQELPSTAIVVEQMQQLLLALHLQGEETLTRFLECNPVFGAEVHRTLLKMWVMLKTHTRPVGLTSV